MSKYTSGTVVNQAEKPHQGEESGMQIDGAEGPTNITPQLLLLYYLLQYQDTLTSNMKNAHTGMFIIRNLSHL